MHATTRRLSTLALVVSGCSNHSPAWPEATRPAAGELFEQRAAIGSFRETDAAAPRQPSAAELEAQAVAGTVRDPSLDIGSRLQIRKLELPDPAAGATAQFNFGQARRGWVTSMPGGDLIPTPAFGDGKLFVSGGFGSQQMFAFNAYTGELAWTLAAPDGGPSAAIVVDHKLVFNAESCAIFVADAGTGKLVWHKWLGDPLMSVPVAIGDRVMTAYPASGSHKFAAFALADGKELWSVDVPDDVIRVPQIAGDSVYFATLDGTAHRLRVADGKQVWKRPVGASSALWVDGDRVLLSRKTGDGKVAREQTIVLAAATGKLVSEGDQFAAPYFSGDSRDRKMIAGQAGAWGNVRHASHLGLINVAAGWAFQGSSPSVADGRAYFAIGGEIRAADVSTGKHLWRRTIKDGADAQSVSPPAVVGSQLVFGTIDGQLVFSDIDTGLTIAAYDVGQPILQQPIVAQGWVYVTTTKGKVIGLEVGDPALDGWHMWGGNPQHTGLVATAGTVDPALAASLARPGQGSLRVAPGEKADAGRELPLIKTDVHAEISGFVAQVRLRQQFDNPYDRPIEAVYAFPLPADAAVDDMEMRIGKRVVRARIQRKNQAKKTYAKAKASGQRAALLEQQRPNLFVQRVANIPAKGSIQVDITYAHWLPYAAGEYEFVFPMVAPPRFDPERPKAVLENSEVRAADEVALSVKLHAGLPVDAIESPTHDVAVDRRSDGDVTIRLAAKESIPNRDFALRYRIGGERPQAAVYAHRDGGAGYFSLAIQPPSAPATADIGRREVVFVVDTSSSMKGRSLVQARQVVDRALAGLGDGDTFNLVSFSDKVSRLADSSIPADAEALARARKELAGLSATGGTRMTEAFTWALRSVSAEAGRTPIVVLVTDGYIANEADVLRAIAADLGDTRVYAVGVGSAVNRFLLERAAEVGRGRSVAIAPSEDTAAAAERFAALIDRPVFTDVDIDWGDLAVTDVYPRRLPDLFAGAPLVVHGRYQGKGKATVRVRGTIAGRRHERAIEVALPADAATAEHRAQRTLWARAAIHDRTARLTLRDDPALIEEVTELGLAHRLVTPYTSFVAVDVADDPAIVTAQAPTRATISPARALPGDPELRIPAPADARAVTVLLPFGDSVDAVYEPDLGVWTARFLIPSDAREGVHPIDVVITLASGAQSELTVWYTVDASAPQVDVTVVGDARPGATVTLRARQAITSADLRQANLSRSELTAERIQILSDTRRVSARTAGGAVIPFAVTGPGTWEASFTIPAAARGEVALEVIAVDLAANVARRRVVIPVMP